MRMAWCVPSKAPQTQVTQRGLEHSHCISVGLGRRMFRQQQSLTPLLIALPAYYPQGHVYSKVTGDTRWPSFGMFC